MPYHEGKRISQARWRELHPVGQLFGRTPDGERYVRYAGDEGWTPEEGPGVIRVNERSTRRDRQARVAIASALGVAPDELPEDLKLIEADQFDSHPVALVGGRYPWETDEPDDEPEPANRDYLTAADFAPDEQEQPVAARKGSADGDDTLNRRTERQAREYSALKGLPPHRKDRPSQVPSGRHARYVRSVAAQRGVTPEYADQHIVTKHPLDCPYRSQP